MRRKNKTAVPSVKEFKRALLSIEASLPKVHRKMLLANYHAPNHTITTGQLSKAVGYKNHDRAILQYSEVGDHLCDFLEYEPTTTEGKGDLVWATVLTDLPPTRSNDEWEWTLRPEIVQALEELGWIDEAETSDDEYGTADDYSKAFETLLEEGIHEKHLALLKAHFDAPNHTATWAQLARVVGYPNGGTVHLQYGAFAHRVAERLGIEEPPKEFWLYVLAEWGDEDERGHQAFILRRPVIEALTRLGILPKIERKKVGKAAHDPVKATKKTATKKLTATKVTRKPAEEKAGTAPQSAQTNTDERAAVTRTAMTKARIIKVFLSSTCFDLVDLRQELRLFLENNGFTVALSEDPRSPFLVDPLDDSIASCLHNVENSNVVVCIIDRRYGGILKTPPYDGLCATQLEVRHARAVGVPCFFFVRDLAWLDYQQLRADPSRTSHWVEPDNPDKKRKWADFVTEASSMPVTAGISNWRDTFSASTDLKGLVLKRLSDHFSVQLADEYEHQVGLLTAQVETARTRLKVAESQYSVGTISQDKVLAAKSALLDAELRLSQVRGTQRGGTRQHP